MQDSCPWQATVSEEFSSSDLGSGVCYICSRLEGLLPSQKSKEVLFVLLVPLRFIHFFILGSEVQSPRLGSEGRSFFNTGAFLCLPATDLTPSRGKSSMVWATMARL